MKCLPQRVSYHVYMDNYFTSFRLLAHFSEHNIHATGVLKEKKLAMCEVTSDKQLEKKPKRLHRAKKKPQTNLPKKSQFLDGMIIVLPT